MKLTQWIGALMMGAGLGLIFFAFSLHHQLFSSTFRAYIITSGSMHPSVRAGSVVFVRTSPSYRQGDIISFKESGSEDNIVTHRIYAKYYPDGIFTPPVYLTSGDKNEDLDTWTVKDEHIIGRVFLSVPRLGYLANFAQTPRGFVLLVIIPASIIIYEELKKIAYELFRNVKRLKSRSFVPLAAPFLGTTLLFAAASGSFFFDRDTAHQNTLSVASSFSTQAPPSTPTVQPSYPAVVINEIYYDVAPDKGDEGNSSNPDEWLELYNNTSSSINLQNWTISDNSASRNISPSAKEIPAYGFAFISKSASTWSSWTIPDAAQKIELEEKIGNGLDNTGDYLILKDSGGVVIDQVSWRNDTSGTLPLLPSVPEGYSLERDPDGTDTDTASDFTNREVPTPGS